MAPSVKSVVHRAAEAIFVRVRRLGWHLDDEGQFPLLSGPCGHDLLVFPHCHFEVGFWLRFFLKVRISTFFTIMPHQMRKRESYEGAIVKRLRRLTEHE